MLPLRFSRMGDPLSPAMSVVITTPDSYQTIRKTMSHLRRQTAREVLEVVIVAPSLAELQLDESEMSDFGSYTVVEAGSIESIGRSNALGIRRAAAPIVVLAEDHCFPEPDWAEALIAAHRGAWAAVGPAVRNANPRTIISWADLFIAYGPWLWPTPAREVDFLPGHNSSYKREILLGYGDQLESMMEAETVLHWDLRAKGHRLYLESAARVAHTNFSLWSSWIRIQFMNGHHFAGARVRQMSRMRRLAYVAGSPMIPFVRLIRIASAVRSRGLQRRFFLCVPFLVVGLLLDGAGQLFGYLTGAHDTVRGGDRLEFHRMQRISETDRRQLLAE
jgi:hypothetical protein